MRVLYLKKSCISLFPSCEKHAVPCYRITQFCFIFIYLRCFLSFAETKQKAKFLLFNYHRSRNSSRELNGNADILKNVTYINFFVCSPLFFDDHKNVSASTSANLFSRRINKKLLNLSLECAAIQFSDSDE